MGTNGHSLHRTASGWFHPPGAPRCPRGASRVLPSAFRSAGFGSFEPSFDSCRQAASRLSKQSSLGCRRLKHALVRSLGGGGGGGGATRLVSVLLKIKSDANMTSTGGRASLCLIFHHLLCSFHKLGYDPVTWWM